MQASLHFTSPRWLAECGSSLSEVSQSGIYSLITGSRVSGSPLFMITGEVDTEFIWKEKARRIHLLVLCPNIDVAKQINDRISKYGDLNSDGRPKLKVSAPQLTEIITEINPWNEVIPAHVWTPFFQSVWF